MKHAREDYNRIQDPERLIPEDEPVFLLRAQDVVAPEIVEYWAAIAGLEGASDAMVKSAMRQATAMREWQKEHKMKVPDLPEEVKK